ncbi:ABC transporter permease [Limnoglobus roseus]|uniref:ABC transporter permease n=1 Tax=Limnoglobus roseus TaxID=2598579 RepID=A0A5C1AEE3_9BACT|nr:ABC transporter permease [Limnoglobus roseus]QEL16577.1 ABC transporter permease [Limnoglobus roseus]
MAKLSLILTLAGKDWRLFWADRRAAVLSFVVPILLASAFGLIFDRPSHADSQVKLPLLIVVEGDSPFVRQVVADLEGCSRIETQVVSREEADRRLEDRRPGVAVVIPAGFEQFAERPTLEIRHHPLCAMEAQWAEGVVTEVVMKRYAADRLGPLVGTLALQPPFETHAVAVGGPETRFNSYSHSFCGMTIQYLLFWGMESGLLLLRERRRGVWQRLRAGPVPFSTVLIGKAFATAGIALLQALTTFAFGYLAFGVTVGPSVVGFLVMAFVVCLFAAAIGLLVAAVGGTESRARSVSVLAILGLSMLGGLWLPTFLLPGWLRDVSLSLPTTWAMRGLEGATWQGRDFLGTLPSVAAVLGFTALFLTVAWWKLAAAEKREHRGLTI